MSASKLIHFRLWKHVLYASSYWDHTKKCGPLKMTSKRKSRRKYFVMFSLSGDIWCFFAAILSGISNHLSNRFLIAWAEHMWCQHKGLRKQGNIVAEALLPWMFSRMHAHATFVRKTFFVSKKQKLVSELIQKHFVSAKKCFSNKCFFRAQTGKYCCGNILRNVSATIERLRLAFTANGKRQKWPRDHDFSSFAVYRSPFLRGRK